jgi:hypothetical protein
MPETKEKERPVNPQPEQPNEPAKQPDPFNLPPPGTKVRINEVGDQPVMTDKELA